MNIEHSMSCEWPEGCSCGASQVNYFKRRLAKAELDVSTLAAELTAKLAELESVRAGQVTLLRAAWEKGFRLCRVYGDNHFHFADEQKELQWKKALEELMP